MTTQKRPARRKPTVTVALVVWGAFLVGLLGSFGFNVAYTVTTNGVGPSLAVAFLWPLLNLSAVKLMIWVPWRPGRGWGFARFGLSGGVAVISFVISASHIYHVMVGMGEPTASAIAAPFAIDVLMTLSGVAMVALSAPKPAARRKAPVRKPAARRAPVLSVAAAPA